MINFGSWTNRQEFSIFFTLIDLGNYIKIFETQKELRVAREWFHCKFLNILTSFLCSIRVQSIEKCCWLVFWNNMDSFDVHFLWSFSENRARNREKQIDLIHYIRHLCTRFRIDRIKAMSRGISGANKR